MQKDKIEKLFDDNYNNNIENVLLILKNNNISQIEAIRLLIRKLKISYDKSYDIINSSKIWNDVLFECNLEEKFNNLLNDVRTD